MAATNTQVLKNSGGKFVSVQVSNTKRSGTVVGKVVNVTPSYVVLNTFRNYGFGTGFETVGRVRKFHKNSIQRVSR